MSEFPPSGCRWCGIAKHHHFGRWSKALADTGVHGWHLYIQPTREQIKERMLERLALPRVELPAGRWLP